MVINSSCPPVTTGHSWRWLSGAVVLGKFSVLGIPTNLDNSRPRAYCTGSKCSQRLFGHFFFHPSFILFSPSPGDGPIETEILLKGH